MSRRGTGVDWDRIDLGQRTDQAISIELGVSRSTVRQARVARGISKVVLVVDPDKTKFYQRVVDGLAWDGNCLVWTGWVNDDGYGKLKYRGLTHSVHRVVYEWCVGPIPPELNVLHHCDNPPCALPKHLFLGTQLDNIKDMNEKGRRRSSPLRGSESPTAKLTWDDVREIRRLYGLGGVSQESIARTLGVSRRTIGFIVNGETWAE